jgi:lipopolysaccharide assembly LptE-like protein
MKKIILFSTFILITLSLSGCGAYNFTGAKPINAKTFQVNYFQNNADLVQPGIERTFTQQLQELIQNQTNLSLTNSGADLVYEGEITDFRISPMQATADQRAAQNRLTITVNVRFTNKNKEDDNFEKPFSFFFDYSGSEQLVGAQLTEAVNAIYERITQDVFNASLAKW